MVYSIQKNVRLHSLGFGLLSVDFVASDESSRNIIGLHRVTAKPYENKPKQILVNNNTHSRAEFLFQLHSDSYRWLFEGQSAYYLLPSPKLMPSLFCSNSPVQKDFFLNRC